MTSSDGNSSDEGFVRLPSCTSSSSLCKVLEDEKAMNVQKVADEQKQAELESAEVIATITERDMTEPSAPSSDASAEVTGCNPSIFDNITRWTGECELVSATETPAVSVSCDLPFVLMPHIEQWGGCWRCAGQY